MGAGFQSDFPQAIAAIAQAGEYYLVVFQEFYIKFHEDCDTVVITEFPHGDEGACCDVVEYVGGLCFGRIFFDSCKVARKAGLMMFLLAT